MAPTSPTDGPAERRDLGSLLRAHRHRLVITQDELARAAGVGTRTISDLERGATGSARLSTVRKLAAALRLSEIETQQMLHLARPARDEAPRHGPEGSAVRDAVRDAVVSGTVGSWERSLSAYEAAIAHAAERPDPDLGELADALIGFGRAATMGLRRQDARPALVRAARLALQLRDRDRLVEAAAWYSFMTKAGEPGFDAAEVWQNGLLVLADDDLAGRATLAAARATVSVLDHQVAAAPERARHALVLARRSGDADAVAVAISAVVLATWGHPNPGERRALAEELTTLTAPRFPHAGLAGVELQAVPRLELGDVPGFEHCAEALATAAAEAHHPFATAQAHMWRAASHLLRGELDDAEATSHSAVAAAGRAPNFTAAHVAQMFAIRRAAGREGELVDVVAAGVEAQPMELAWRAGLALAALGAGEEERARAIADRVAFELWPPAPTWTLPVTLAYLAEVAWRLGHDVLGGLVAGTLGAYDGELVVLGTGSACEGAVAHHLGLAALARGDRTTGRAALERALATHAALGAPLLVARTEAALAS